MAPSWAFPSSLALKWEQSPLPTSNDPWGEEPGTGAGEVQRREGYGWLVVSWAPHPPLLLQPSLLPLHLA